MYVYIDLRKTNSAFQYENILRKIHILICFSLVVFNCTSDFAGYLVSNPVYTHILNKWFGANSLKVTSQNLFVCTELNGFKYC